MVKQDIVIIRYGHREVRDFRVTSHCALVSRALGASKIIICGTPDETVEKTIKGVNARWGGKFEVKFSEGWLSTVKKLKKKGYKIAHLTMYGIPIQRIEKELEKITKLAIIIGSQKVERAVYENADYNISVASQPHSEIAALAIVLDRIQQGKELEKEQKGAGLKVVPQSKGKKVIDLK
ncbi:MAG: tRNA (cytidine(56)-2'-O)-methyltransferase [Candidatus Diapherotrites archaeon]|nr:tRNA (cytidine(56)-2'-O)-methyltransferase [Candidatus Diapherotrites archaeon]